MLCGGYQPKQKRPEDMPVVSVPTKADVHMNKALEQQPSDDCVSRKDVLEMFGYETAIYDLPPVTPTFPKGATNGDMIKTMFPYIKIHEHEKTDICDAHIQIDIWDFTIYVSKDWWDTPYKRGNENEVN